MTTRPANMLRRETKKIANIFFESSNSFKENVSFVVCSVINQESLHFIAYQESDLEYAKSRQRVPIAIEFHRINNALYIDNMNRDLINNIVQEKFLNAVKSFTNNSNLRFLN